MVQENDSLEMLKCCVVGFEFRRGERGNHVDCVNLPVVLGLRKNVNTFFKPVLLVHRTLRVRLLPPMPGEIKNHPVGGF